MYAESKGLMINRNIEAHKRRFCEREWSMSKMSFEHGKIPAINISMIILVATICLFALTPIALADTSANSQPAVAYNISGYVFVDGMPMDNVLVYTTNGGDNRHGNGADGAGRHGYYSLSAIASQGPVKVIAVYTGYGKLACPELFEPRRPSITPVMDAGVRSP